jgi:hypothetical protein
VKTLTLDLRVELPSDFGDVKTSCAGNARRKKEIEKTILRDLRSRAFSHSLGQSRPKRHARTKSAFFPNSDIVDGDRHVSNVPQADRALKRRASIKHEPASEAASVGAVVASFGANRVPQRSRGIA